MKLNSNESKLNPVLVENLFFDQSFHCDFKLISFYMKLKRMYFYVHFYDLCNYSLKLSILFLTNS